MRKESLNRSAQNAGKAARRRNQAFVVFPHAFDNLHGFKMAHNRADIDFIGCVGKTQSASFPSYAGQESAFDKRGNDFHQMTFGNVIGFGNGSDID